MYVLQKFNKGHFDELKTKHQLQNFTLSIESSKQFVKALLKILLLFNSSKVFPMGIARPHLIVGHTNFLMYCKLHIAMYIRT